MTSPDQLFSYSLSFRLLLEVGVAQSNGVVRIAAKHSKIAFALKYGEKTTKLCQITKISLLVIENQCRPNCNKTANINVQVLTVKCTD